MRGRTLGGKALGRSRNWKKAGVPLSGETTAAGVDGDRRSSTAHGHMSSRAPAGETMAGAAGSRRISTALGLHHEATTGGGRGRAARRLARRMLVADSSNNNKKGMTARGKARRGR
jgi:hypothetical protein